MELLTKFACMDYDREADNYRRRVLRNMLNGKVVYVPRYIPPYSRWEPEYLEYKAKVNICIDDDKGRLCWVPFDEVMDRMFRFDGDSLPDLNIFSEEHPFTIILQMDATGFGSLSISQMIFRNTHTSQSPRHCHLAGLLRGGDDYEGTGLLHGCVAQPLKEARAAGSLPHPHDSSRRLPTQFLGSGDKMGILHINARSQMCTCRGTDQRLALPDRNLMLGSFKVNAAPQLRALCFRPDNVLMITDAHARAPCR